MMNNIEDLLRNNYCQYRLKRGKKKVYKEIPVFSRSVDLVEFNSRLRKITAIEFKIHDWKRAIDQLITVSPCFDFLVLCIPRPKTEKCISDIKSKCTEMGIGLITWESNKNEFIKECEPREVETIWDVQKKNIIRYIMAEEKKQ